MASASAFLEDAADAAVDSASTLSRDAAVVDDAFPDADDVVVAVVAAAAWSLVALVASLSPLFAVAAASNAVVLPTAATF